MAKLGKVSNRKPIPLSFDGVFIRNLPAKVIEDKFGNIGSDLQEDQEKMIVAIFTDLICDEKGDKFEGCDTLEEITSVLSIMDIQAIVSAIPSALAPDPVTTGK
jgi:hypothetical protein